MAQTVTECLATGTYSVTLIDDIKAKGSSSIHAGASTDADGNVVVSTWTQAEINECILRNVDHLRTDRYNDHLTICYDCQKVIKNL